MCNTTTGMGETYDCSDYAPRLCPVLESVRRFRDELL